MVCVAVKGTPIIGVIHKPFETEPQTFWAWKGKGSSDNLKPNKVFEKVLSCFMYHHLVVICYLKITAGWRSQFQIRILYLIVVDVLDHYLAYFLYPM